MISNANLANKPKSCDPELTLYARRELNGTIAVLAGAHETYRVPRGTMRTRRGAAHRARRWMAHSLTSLIALTGTKP